MKIRAFVMPLVLAAGFGTAAIAQGLGNGAATNQPSPGQGDSGSPGQTEPAGAGGVFAGGSAQLFAVVNADGTIARDKGALSTSKITTGEYQVDFARTLTACVFTATVGNAGAGSQPPSFVTVALRAGTQNAVFVETRDATGALADRAFHLWVNC